MMDDTRRHHGEDTRDHRRHRHRSSRERPSNSREEQSDRRRRHHHRRRRSESKRSSERSLSPGEVREAPLKQHRRRYSSRRTSEPTEQPPKPHPVLSNTPAVAEQVRQTASPSVDESTDSDSGAIGPMPLPEVKPTRTPRRGEYGHDAKDIERFEQMGFVMSGNRKKRKNSDDGKRGVMASKEEKALRETEIVRKFREMIEERKGWELQK